LRRPGLHRGVEDDSASVSSASVLVNTGEGDAAI
jgi:hypothetical protein